MISVSTLDMLAAFDNNGVSLLMAPNVHRGRLCLSRGDCSRDRNNVAPEICPIFQSVDTHQQTVVSCDSGTLRVRLKCRLNYFFFENVNCGAELSKIIVQRGTINKTIQRHMWISHLNQGFTNATTRSYTVDV